MSVETSAATVAFNESVPLLLVEATLYVTVTFVELIAGTFGSDGDTLQLMT